MNVSLTPELEKFVSAKVESGRYNSASEVVREALRLLEEHDSARAAQLAEFNQFGVVARRVNGIVPPMLGVPEIADTHLHPEVVLQKHGFIEHLIIADHPGCNRGQQRECRGCRRHHPVFSVAMQTIAEPAAQKRHDG